MLACASTASMKQDHGEAPERGGEHGSEAGASVAARGRRPDADGDEVPVAGEPSHDGSRPADAAVSSARGVQAHGPGVALEGDGVAPVELYQQGLGEEGLDGVGGVGIPKQAAADGQGGRDGAEAPRGDPERGGVEDDQRSRGVDERHDQAAKQPSSQAAKRIKAMACGYRNRERFRNALLFHLGGLDLYPRPASTHAES